MLPISIRIVEEGAACAMPDVMYGEDVGAVVIYEQRNRAEGEGCQGEWVREVVAGKGAGTVLFLDADIECAVGKM